MNSITLSRSFLREGIIVLIGFVLLVEVFSWSSDYKIKMIHVEHAGGILPYVSILTRSLILPEIVTVLLLTILMYWVRRLLKIKSVDLTWTAIGRYELVFLPIMIMAFMLTNFFTQSVRYLVSSPDYSFSTYWHLYIIRTYSWQVYFRYLVPILLIGYSTLNISLLLDYIKPSTRIQLI